MNDSHYTSIVWEIREILTHQIIIKARLYFWLKIFNLWFKIIFIPFFAGIYYIFRDNTLALIIVNLLTFISLLYCILITNILTLPKEKWFGYLWSIYIENFLASIEQSKNNLIDFNSIFIAVKKIHKFILILIKVYKKSKYLLIPESEIQLKIALEKAFMLILMNLHELSSDLDKKITTQKQILSQANFLLSKTTKINESDGIIEFQKTRIDRQIEQFEELQKVLVKTS